MSAREWVCPELRLHRDKSSLHINSHHIAPAHTRQGRLREAGILVWHCHCTWTNDSSMKSTIIKFCLHTPGEEGLRETGVSSTVPAQEQTMWHVSMFDIHLQRILWVYCPGHA